MIYLPKKFSSISERKTNLPGTKFTAILILLLGSFPVSANSTVIFINSESAWVTQSGGIAVNEFDFSLAENIALAEEVDTPPVPDSLIGQALTFRYINTSFPLDFIFSNESPDAGTQVYYGGILQNALGSSPSTNHDWAVSFDAEENVYSVGLEIVSANTSLTDAIRVYDINGALLDSLNLGTTQGYNFIGVISSAPIGRILYDDNPASGGKGLTRMLVSNSNALLNGNYVVNQFGDDGTIWTSRLRVNFDGVGNLTSSTLSSSNGAIETFDSPYSVNVDGIITTPNGVDGVVSSDGQVFTLTDTNSIDGSVHIMIGIKESTSLSNGDLSGEYFSNQIGQDTEIWTSQAVDDYDGIDSFISTVTASSKGAVAPSTGNYSVTSNGELALSNGDNGIASSNGNIYSISDTQPSDSDLYIKIGVKPSVGLSIANLVGRYTIVQFGDDGAVWTARLSVIFDGKGNLTSSTLSNSNGVIETAYGTYNVLSDGKLTTNFGVDGFIAENGEFFVLSDTDFQDGTIHLMVGIKNTDADHDTVIDQSDNCVLIFNIQQRDTDGDGYGNYCDPDFNNDYFINAADLAYLKIKYFSSDSDADLNGDNFVNAGDLSILKQMYFSPPGPSGLVH